MIIQVDAVGWETKNKESDSRFHIILIRVIPQIENTEAFEDMHRALGVKHLMFSFNLG